MGDLKLSCKKMFAMFFRSQCVKCDAIQFLDSDVCNESRNGVIRFKRSINGKFFLTVVISLRLELISVFIALQIGVAKVGPATEKLWGKIAVCRFSRSIVVKKSVFR